MFRKLLSVIVVVIFAAGCGVKAETYVITKERVGIKDTGGNNGYLAGKHPYLEPEKKTRKIYVLELSKPVAETDVKTIKQEEQVSVQKETVPAQMPQPNVAHTEFGAGVTLPPVVEPPSAAAAEAGPKEAVTYTVQKDDTLQKIAKKFYDSYGKWMKIYDANKDKIKNPNFVKPGTVITIPAVEEKK